MPVETRAAPIVYGLSDLFDILGVNPPDLLLRRYGEKAFPVLEQALLGVPEGRALTLSFAEVEVMATSFADETIVPLLQGLVEGRWGDRYLLLQDPTSDTLDSLEGTFARRRELKLAAVVLRDERPSILGHVERNLEETWHLVAERGALTARALADRLGLEISTASMRLSKLHGARLLARQEDVSPAGRQHVYALPD